MWDRWKNLSPFLLTPSLDSSSFGKTNPNWELIKKIAAERRTTMIIKEIKNTLDISKKVSDDSIAKKDIPAELDRLTSMMKIASSQLDFERAIELRNKIATLKKRLNRKDKI